MSLRDRGEALAHSYKVSAWCPHELQPRSTGGWGQKLVNSKHLQSISPSCTWGGRMLRMWGLAVLVRYLSISPWLSKGSACHAFLSTPSIFICYKNHRMLGVVDATPWIWLWKFSHIQRSWKIKQQSLIYPLLRFFQLTFYYIYSIPNHLCILLFIHRFILFFDVFLSKLPIPVYFTPKHL